MLEDIQFTQASMRWQKACYDWYRYWWTAPINLSRAVAVHSPNPDDFTPDGHALAQEYLDAREAYLEAIKRAQSLLGQG